MNSGLTSSGKRIGAKHQGTKGLCSFSLEHCLSRQKGTPGAGYLCPFTLETFERKQSGMPACRGIRIARGGSSRNCH